MFEYFTSSNTYHCISDKYIFYCINNFYDIVEVYKSSIEYVKAEFKSHYSICTMEEFEKAFVSSHNSDDIIYLYYKEKTKNLCLNVTR